MTRHFDVQKVSRRGFLIGSGAAAIAVSFSGLPGTSSGAAAATEFTANAWVSIGADGIVTIMSPASEMGQGSLTAVPVIVAEELDADWAKVKIAQPPSYDKNFGNPRFNNQRITVGSLAITGYWDNARIAGATARKILVATAAEQMKVPVSELTTEAGMVKHAKSGKSLSYGDLAKVAKVPDPLPVATSEELKKPGQFRLIGKDIPRVELPGKVNGTAQYAIDLQLPDMLYAMVVYPDVQRERAEKIDDTEAKKIKGYVKFVPLPAGVAVVGETIDSVLKARNALKVTWTNTALGRSYNDEKILAEFKTVAADWSTAGIDMIKIGDADAAIKGADRVLNYEFTADHVAHVCMEPMNTTVRAEGPNVEVWSGNQWPPHMQIMAAIGAKTSPDKVKVNTLLLGGGFGRKADGDDVLQAAIIARANEPRPVKMIWTREDDLKNDKLRPLTLQRIEVGLDKAGNIAGWRHRTVNESYFARVFPPKVFEAMGKKDFVVGGNAEFPYKVPAQRADWVPQVRGIDVGAWRATSSGYTKFAIETIIDELAAMKGMDPLAFRLSLLDNEPRVVGVLKKAADMAKWGTPRASGRALGIAYSDESSHTAAVAEVSLDEKTGAIKVHHIWAAIDPGIAVQPKNLIAQVRGGMVFGLGAALYERTSFKDGVNQDLNFDTYRVVRQSDMPQMDVEIIPSAERPTGVAEAGPPVVAPAIANAVAQLTGKRLRQLPMTPDRVLSAIRGT